MATAISAGLSAKEGRKFGLTVGAAFLVLGALLWWRGRALAPWLGSLGAVLALAGLVVPARLGPVQRAWMGLAWSSLRHPGRLSASLSRSTDSCDPRLEAAISCISSTTTTLTPERFLRSLFPVSITCNV